MKDEFNTIEAPAEGYYMDHASKFIAYAYPVESEAGAMIVLQKLRKDHPKARHFCTALRLYPDASLVRSSDDGEPSGSAGKPILGQLIKNDLTNVYVVVVRYFGGTKLGIPGLIEAYKTSTANALLESRIVKKKVLSIIRITAPHESMPPIINQLRKRGIPILREDYQDKSIVEAGFPKSTLHHDLLAFFREITHMDFESIDDHAAHLHIHIEITPDSLIR